MTKKHPVFKFIKQEVAAVASKDQWLHLAGMKQKIDYELIQHYRTDVDSKAYSKVEYLVSKPNKYLTPTLMVRLDQLPKFQDRLHNMPQEV